MIVPGRHGYLRFCPSLFLILVMMALVSTAVCESISGPHKLQKLGYAHNPVAAPPRAVTCTSFVNSDILIGSTIGPPKVVNNADECCSECIRQNCRGWTFDSTTSICLIKDSNVVTPTNSTSTVVAGVLNDAEVCYFYPGYIHNNGDVDVLAKIEEDGVGGCCTRCDDYPGCVGWTHFTNSAVSPRCFLHSSNTLRPFVAGVTGGLSMKGQGCPGSSTKNA